MGIRNGKRPARRIKKDGSNPVYTSPEEMLDKIEEYILTGHEKKKVTVGRASAKKVEEISVISIIGLALFLGFRSRSALDYFKSTNKAYEKVIEYGKSLVARHYEGLLQAGVSPTGMMHMLNVIDGMRSDIGLIPQDDKDVIRKITFTNNLTKNTINVTTAKKKEPKAIEVDANEVKDQESNNFPNLDWDKIGNL